MPCDRRERITLREGWHDRCCAFPQGYAKAQLAKGRTKPTAKTGKNFQKGAWHSCLSAKLAKSTSRLFCGVCNVAWEMLCKIWLKLLILHLAIALCEVGTHLAMYFAKRGKPREKIKPQKTT
jgi:hypothetical protein